MEPWLDSLSEDWKSEGHSSSPAASVSNRRLDGSIVLSKSQSRIPHLAQNIRKDSSASFLKPRSTRGIARARNGSALTERSASSLNLPPPTTFTSQKRTSVSTLPRRASSVFSESQDSVQHHTLHERPKNDDTPDWRRRLANGEDMASDGIDLFAPSKLEGIFKTPAASKLLPDTENSLVEGLSATWKPFELPPLPSIDEQYQSLRASRSRPLGLEVLEEVDEEDTDRHALSAISSDLVRDGSVRSIVRQRVKSLERVQGEDSTDSSLRQVRHDSAAGAHAARDPRWRTISGQAEIMNELISPVTMSRTDTLRNNALLGSMDMDISALDQKLADIGLTDGGRPSSRSSDYAVPYGHVHAFKKEGAEDLLADQTSQSLPEDLSMGTQQDLNSNGGFVNHRRGGYSNEFSFLRQSLGSSAEDSRLESRLKQNFRSSPPPYNPVEHFPDGSKFTASLPTSPNDDSVLHHQEHQLKPTTSGSPLKLFGNHDTYTEIFLKKMVSRVEEAEKLKDQADADAEVMVEPVNPGMSQFGHGELDDFHFENDAGRPEMKETHSINQDAKVFLQVQSETEPRPNIPLLPSQDISLARNTDDSGTKFASPSRTPKRRRTLLTDAIVLEEMKGGLKVDQLQEDAILAGKKRKDARPGDVGAPAEPDVLASRTLLQPRSTRGSSSLTKNHAMKQSHPLTQAEGGLIEDEEDLTDALAAELASFAHEAAELHTDSRKASLATKDYMEEANKVMQFIRASGKPKKTSTESQEPSEVPELNPDAILDLDIDDESTKDNFSRPPSREGLTRSTPARRHAVHDSRTADYLRQYQDVEDLELVANTSALGTLHMVDNKAAMEASLVPIPDDTQSEQESSPPNIRILNHNDTQRKRKHSTSTFDGPSSAVEREQMQSYGSSSNSTRRTFPTSSSSATGNKGIITSGTVSIPDHVGKMTFDHERKVWIQKAAVKTDDIVKEHKQRQRESEEDPFENIPDLSIDEKQEVRTGTMSAISKLPRVSDSKPTTPDDSDQIRPAEQRIHYSLQGSAVWHEQAQTENDGHLTAQQSSMRSEASKHEVRLHDGVPSQPPANSRDDMKPRAVTIAFSSPLVSAVQYHEELVLSDADLDYEVDLPLDDSEISLSPVRARKINARHAISTPAPQKGSLKNKNLHPVQYSATTFHRRPVSRIEEHDENDKNLEMSLVHVIDAGALTPAPRQQCLTKTQHSTNHQASILCLTPLSDFSLHQVDSVKHPDESYVEERPNPNALRTARGSLALAVDTLVKAITDAEPTELYWEHVRRLRLENKGLSTLHGLADYCSSLEQLSVAGNQISQLGGLPTSLRVLDIQQNLLTSLTSWGLLHNLQYVDVSDNQLESLEGFSSLVHLRSLIANNNHIRDIDGVLDLDGLLELQLRGNDLIEVDFDGTELVRLTKLDLSHNHLRTLSNLQCLPGLRELQVQHNGLSAFGDPQTTILATLQTLDISANNFETFYLTQFPELKLLDGDNNKIQSISGLGEAYNLQTLSLRDQTAAPELVSMILSSPNECRKICLSSNSVQDGSFALPAMPQCNLRELEIAGCGISELPVEFGDFFPNCRKLNLNFNAIKDICVLQGMSKLTELLLARNRIKRLRRTCIVLSRLKHLSKVDLRDNTLTLGFYPPLHAVKACEDDDPAEKYVLPRGSREQDDRWVKIGDEITGLRRRTIELLLAERCPRLTELDGLDFVSGNNFTADEVWQNLTAKGVLMKPELPEDEEVAEKEAEVVESPLHADNLVQERSLIVE